MPSIQRAEASQRAPAPAGPCPADGVERTWQPPLSIPVAVDPLDRLVQIPRSERELRSRALQEMYANCRASPSLQRAGALLRDLASDLAVAWVTLQLSQMGGHGQSLRDSAPEPSSAAGYQRMSLSLFFVQQASTLVTRHRELWRGQKLGGLEAIGEVHQRLLRRREKDHLRLSSANISKLDQLDEAILNYRVCLYQEGARNLLEKRQTVCLSQPVEILDISHQHRRGDAARRRALDAAVSCFLDEYPHLPRDVLATFIGQARANCYLARPRRAQMHLWGPSGTGKTRFARRLAQVLGLPLVEVSLRAEDFKIFSTHPDPRAAGGWIAGASGAADHEAAGPFAVGLASSGVLNPLFFCDEAESLFRDPSCRDALKHFLDPDALTLHLNRLCGFHVDFSRASLIFASNAMVEDEALMTRLKQVEFGGLERRHKERVVRRVLADEVGNHAALGEASVEQIRSALEPWVAVLLDCDEALRIPGVRTAIEVARELVGFVGLRLTNTQLAEASVAQFIRQAFEGRTKKPPGESAAKAAASGVDQPHCA